MILIGFNMPEIMIYISTYNILSFSEKFYRRFLKWD